MPTFNFTTGPSTLPDVGELSYNGCVFSPLFATEVSGAFVKDDAGRTTKTIEYTITADGYVTLPDGEANVHARMATLEALLSAPAGALRYEGRGIEVDVNIAGGDRDVAWGPIPEILDITPLGAGRSAHIKWTVKTRIPPRVPKGTTFRLGPVLQFCYDTSTSYDDAGYCTWHMSGIVEIPLTRNGTTNRTVTTTADNFRENFPGRLLATIDLKRFKVMQRDFKLSKDKRTLEFSIEAREHSWMINPPDITIARGQFTFKPVKTGAGLCNWLCTLTCTYTVAKERPRRIAWLAFLALLRVRLNAGNLNGAIPAPGGNQNPALNFITATVPPFIALDIGMRLWRRMTQNPRPIPPNRKVFLVDFSGSEGLYEDARTVTFSATWRLGTTFTTILVASGLWKKVPEHTEQIWATSVSNISGYSSWYQNRADPAADAIIDFGV